MLYSQFFIILFSGLWLWVCVMKTKDWKYNFSAKCHTLLLFLMQVILVNDPKYKGVWMYHMSNKKCYQVISLQIIIGLFQIRYHILRWWVVISVSNRDEISSRSVMLCMSIHHEHNCCFLKKFCLKLKQELNNF